MTPRQAWIKTRNCYQRNVARFCFRRRLLIDTPWPLISFTFDDFPRSALLTGGAILNRYGLSGTYYASLGLVGREEPTGHMFLAPDLVTLLAQRHELGCHTFHHCHSWYTDQATFERSIIANAVALEKLVPGAAFKCFSYPIGAPRPITKSKAAKYFMCCRGGGQTFNTGMADLNQLSAFFLEKNQGGIETVKELIDRNSSARGWLIFATHGVSYDRSRFGCTPDFFEDVVQYAVASGAHVLPVIQALESIRRFSPPEASSNV
jgi:peptidoglycan/xylan/chitin deacetylase (PgdA/CDA1 family)